MNKALLHGDLHKKFDIKRANSGLGLFAKVPFKKDDFIIEYTGEKLTNAQADERGGKYLMTLNSRYTIDGSGREHAARYINHSCKPNAKPYYEKGKVHIYALKKIAPGDEITYDYGKEYVEEFISPNGCRCSACLC